MRTGISFDTTRQTIANWTGIQRHRNGAIPGHWGLTIREMKHHLRVAGRQLYTWCAWQRAEVGMELHVADDAQDLPMPSQPAVHARRASISETRES